MTLLNLHNQLFTFNGDKTSSIFSILFTIWLALTPVGLFLFVWRLDKKYINIEFNKKYGSVYSDLNMNNPLSKWYSLTFVLRRLFISISAIFLSEYLFAQYIVVTYGTLLQMSFTLHVNQFYDHRMNKIENLNDLTILFSIPFLYLFTTPDPEAKFNYGWGLIALNMANILFNLSFAFTL